jgi:hypothetical protein
MEFICNGLDQEQKEILCYKLFIDYVYAVPNQ